MSQNEFAENVSRKVVCDIIETSGFQYVRMGAVDIMCDLLRAFIVNVGNEATQWSNHSGRTEQNIYDVFAGIHSVSGTTSDGIIEYQNAVLDSLDDQLQDSQLVSSRKFDKMTLQELDLSCFEYDVPYFPISLSNQNDVTSTQGLVNKTNKVLNYLLQEFEKQQNEKQQKALQNEPETNAISQSDSDAIKYFKVWQNNLPSFLPQLPPKHTYLFTPVCKVMNERLKRSYALQEVKTKQKRQMEYSLTQLQVSAFQQSKTAKEDSGLPATQKNNKRNRIEDEWYQLYQATGLASSRNETGAEASSSENYFAKKQKVVNPYLVVVKENISDSSYEHEYEKFLSAPTTTTHAIAKSVPIPVSEEEKKNLVELKPIQIPYSKFDYIPINHTDFSGSRLPANSNLQLDGTEQTTTQQPADKKEEDHDPFSLEATRKKSASSASSSRQEEISKNEFYKKKCEDLLSKSYKDFQNSVVDKKSGTM